MLTSLATWPSPSRWSDVILGVGIDVVDVARFIATLERTPRLREKLFTELERDLPDASLAARFAAKEAIAKALGAPGGMRWHDATVLRLPGGAPVVELHTGHYSDLHAEGRMDEAEAELEALRRAAVMAHGLGLEVHAGHGLTFDNVAPVAAMPHVRELNIGHFLIGEAVFIGLGAAIDEMRRRMDAAVG